MAGLLALVIASFWSLDLQWGQFLSLQAARDMGRFLGEFFPPDVSPDFLAKVAVGAWETLAMSALGTVLAAIAGLALALPASRLVAGDTACGARAHPLAAQCLARHPRAGLGRAAADLGRARPLRRHAGAGPAHHRRARAPVCRSGGKRPHRPGRCPARAGRGPRPGLSLRHPAANPAAAA